MLDALCHVVVVVKKSHYFYLFYSHRKKISFLGMSVENETVVALKVSEIGE